MPIDLSYDPRDVVVTDSKHEELKAARLTNLQAPVTCADGCTFQFTQDDRATMEAAITALTAIGSGTLDWRLLDNTTIAVNATQLQSYFDELIVKQATRGLVIDVEYLAIKSGGSYTRRDIAGWVAVYSGGYVP